MQAQKPEAPAAALRRKTGPIRGVNRRAAKVRGLELKQSKAAVEVRERIGGEYEFLRVFVFGPKDNWQHVHVVTSEGLQARHLPVVFV